MKDLLLGTLATMWVCANAIAIAAFVDLCRH